MTEATTPSKPDVTALLADLLAAFGTKPAKAARPKANAKSLPRNAKPLTLAQEFAELKTGYREWTAVEKVIHIEEQVCACCGTRTPVVRDELYLLSHKTSYSKWLRHEGYGIVEPELLPLRYVDLEPRVVSACGYCRLPDTDMALLAVIRSSQQMSLPL